MKHMFQIARRAALLALLTAVPCFAANTAVLRNGFTILYQRSQTQGDTTRLYITGDQASFVDIPTAEIDHFESIPDAPAQTLTPQAKLAPATTSHVFDL